MTTSKIRPITIKLIQPKATNEGWIKNLTSLKRSLNKIFNEGGEHSLNISSDFDLEKVEAYILKEFPDKITIRNGVVNGCYGSSTGEIYKGLTLFCALELFQEYYDPEYKTTFINPLHEIESNGGEVLNYSDEEIESFFDISEDIGLDVHHDNSYNREYEGCDFITGFTFKTVGDYENSKNILAVAFHCGGDTRGNYTRWYLFKFNDTDSLYSVILPYRELSEGVEND